MAGMSLPINRYQIAICPLFSILFLLLGIIVKVLVVLLLLASTMVVPLRNRTLNLKHHDHNIMMKVWQDYKFG